MSYLVFIDTNIYLDYYRPDRSDVSISLLDKIYQNKDRIITTSEVEMEYKKNRQKEILKSRKLIKPKGSGSIKIPPLVKTPQIERSIKAAEEKLDLIAEKLMGRTSKLIESPEINDPVYRVLEKLFRSESVCHLTRDKEIRYEIREHAKKRFILGYPPRKDSDTSIVDAINWEWIIYCAKNCSDSIVIVSRDRDYGEHYQNESILNDWLLQEFKERVGLRRSIILTRRLAEAFKLAAISVSEEEEKSEEKLLKHRYLEPDSKFGLETMLNYAKYLNHKVLENYIIRSIKPVIEDEQLNMETNPPDSDDSDN